MFYTYSHAKPDGSIFYIGKGIGDRAWSKDNRNIHWKRTVAKYGYTVQLMSTWDAEEDAFDHEKLLISCLQGIGIKLVNLTPGGEGSAGYQWTEEQKSRFDISGEKNGMYGKKHSEETKQKIREKAVGRKISEEARKKISDKMKVRIFTDEHRAKLALTSKGNRGSKGTNVNGKKCEIDGVIYPSARNAALALSLGISCVQRRCNNKNCPNFKYVE